MPDYLIVTMIDSDTKTERIVRAKNKAQAIAHVVTDTLAVEVASSDDIMRVAKAGGVIETAAAE